MHMPEKGTPGGGFRESVRPPLTVTSSESEVIDRYTEIQSRVGVFELDDAAEAALEEDLSSLEVLVGKEEGMDPGFARDMAAQAGRLRKIFDTRKILREDMRELSGQEENDPKRGEALARAYEDLSVARGHGLSHEDFLAVVERLDTMKRRHLAHRAGLSQEGS